MANNNLIPDYVDGDYETIKQRLRSLLEKNQVFKDYDFEGSNIAVITELLAYIGDLNTFYVNKLAQNVHPETSDVYEVVHSHVRRQGYEPIGYSSGVVTVTVKISQTEAEYNGSAPKFRDGDQIYLPRWYKFKAKDLTTPDGDDIYYTLPDAYVKRIASTDISNEIINVNGTNVTYKTVSFTLNLIQGEPITDYLVYDYSDIIDNRLYLPVTDKWDHSFANDSVEVLVGAREDLWYRIETPFDDMSAIDDANKVYMFRVDKYGRYYINFLSTRDIPNEDEILKVFLVKTQGVDGSISANIEWEVLPSDIVLDNAVPFIRNITRNVALPVDYYTISNTDGSVGASDIETLDELKSHGELSIQSQFRDVTQADYKGHLESKFDIIKANVWGEQEKQVGLPIDTSLYNQIYMSVIPRDWGTSSITLTDHTIDVGATEFIGSVVETTSLSIPDAYIDAYKTDILRYLAPRKMVGILENFVLPELIFFKFNIGYKVKRSYSAVLVEQDIRNKLAYYFDSTRRDFGDAVDFRDIHNFILDPSIVSEDDDFPYVRGINNLTFRDVVLYNPYDGGGTENNVYDQSGVDITDQPFAEFPYYIDIDNDYTDASLGNILNPIQLGFNHFPVLAEEFCEYINEV